MSFSSGLVQTAELVCFAGTDFPSVETRDKFEEKLAKDIQEVAEEFTAQLKRSEITTVEIIYALAEALNLDDVELGYVMQTASF